MSLITKWGKEISNTVRKGTDAMGLTTPQIPDSAKLQTDPTKLAGLAQYQGAAGQNVSRWGGQTPGGAGYFTPQTYAPQQYASLATPTMQRTQDMNYQNQTQQTPTEASQGNMSLGRYDTTPLNLTNTQTLSQSSMPMEGQQSLNLQGVSGYMPNTSQYSDAASQALQKAQGVNAPTTQGYDPAQKDLAIKSMTAGLDQQEQQGTKDMTEQLSQSGVLNSSAGQAQLAKLKQGYDQQRTNAMTQVNLQDLEAQRADRYQNANLANTDINQIASLASQGQGMGLQSATTKAGLTNQDNANVQANATWLQNQRGIDRNTALQLAQNNQSVNAQNNQNAVTQGNYGRQAVDANNSAAMQEANYGRQGRTLDVNNANQLAQQNFSNNMATQGFNRTNADTNNQNAWNTYNAQYGANQQQTNVNNQAQQYNISNAQTGKELENQSYQNDLKNLASATSGSLYTPQSQAANDQYQQQLQQQSQNLGAWTGYVKTAAQAAQPYLQGLSKAGTVGIAPTQTVDSTPIRNRQAMMNRVSRNKIPTTVQ